MVINSPHFNIVVSQGIGRPEERAREGELLAGEHSEHTRSSLPCPGVRLRLTEQRQH